MQLTYGNHLQVSLPSRRNADMENLPVALGRSDQVQHTTASADLGPPMNATRLYVERLWVLRMRVRRDSCKGPRSDVVASCEVS